MASGFVPHPSDDSSLGPLLNGNAFGRGHGPAADRRGMIGDGLCNSVAKIGVALLKSQETDDGPQEILDVFGLDLHTSASIGLLAFGETLGRSLSVEFD